MNTFRVHSIETRSDGFTGKQNTTLIGDTIMFHVPLEGISWYILIPAHGIVEKIVFHQNLKLYKKYICIFELLFRKGNQCSRPTQSITSLAFLNENVISCHDFIRF